MDHDAGDDKQNVCIAADLGRMTEHDREAAVGYLQLRRQDCQRGSLYHHSLLLSLFDDSLNGRPLEAATVQGVRALVRRDAGSDPDGGISPEPRQAKHCPYCAQRIARTAIKGKHCRTWRREPKGPRVEAGGCPECPAAPARHGPRFMPTAGSPPKTGCYADANRKGRTYAGRPASAARQFGGFAE